MSERLIAFWIEADVRRLAAAFGGEGDDRHHAATRWKFRAG